MTELYKNVKVIFFTLNFVDRDSSSLHTFLQSKKWLGRVSMNSNLRQDISYLRVAEYKLYKEVKLNSNINQVI